MNLGTSSTVELDLRSMPPQLIGQRPSDMLCKAGCQQELPALTNRTLVEVGDYGYAALVGLRLPRWVPKGYLMNCSATYAPPVLVGVMPLTACLIACLHDSECDAVAVDWVKKQAWPKPSQMAWYGNEVQCRLRGGVDLTRCVKDEATLASHSTIVIA
jgi:hypothetical protein